MPEEGVDYVKHTKILTLEEIARFVKVAAGVGISKVRLTGGEPLVRKNITKLISEIAHIPQINDLAITTNGILFADMAADLKAAGLNRVNFSLDSLDSDTFKFITRSGGELSQVLHSIDKALALGMAPLKINTVVMKGINDHEIENFVRLAREMPIHVRFIEFMPIGDLPFHQADKVVTVNEIKAIISQNYELYQGSAVLGNGPAKSFHIRGGVGTVGFISPLSEHFCSECNRVRLTADGKLRNCLFAKEETNLQLALKNTDSDTKILTLLQKAIKEKPRRHYMNDGWGADNNRKMYQIGG
jgi:cyclic pyranopterin phosphate synthase